MLQLSSVLERAQHPIAPSMPASPAAEEGRRSGSWAASSLTMTETGPPPHRETNSGSLAAHRLTISASDGLTRFAIARPSPVGATPSRRTHQARYDAMSPP